MTPEPTTRTATLDQLTAEAERLGLYPQGFSCLIGERTYHIRLDDGRRGSGFEIVSNGDLVEHVSVKHWGFAGALRRVAERLEEIECAWAQNQRD